MHGRPGSAVGFLVRGSQTVYFAGDTGLFPGLEGLADPLDVALLPIWGWGPTLGEGHLDPERAAEAVSLLAPRIVIPIHWGSLHPLGMSRAAFLARATGEFPSSSTNWLRRRGACARARGVHLHLTAIVWRSDSSRWDDR